MEWQQIAAFLLAATLMVISPGPNGLLIAKTAASAGRAAGFANIVGFFTAFYLHGALSIAGVSVILLKSAAAFAVLKYLGAIYLIWIGIKSLRGAICGSGAAVAPIQRPVRSVQWAYAEGLLTNALNPKVSMFYLAVFPQFVQGTPSPWGAAAVLVTLHALVNLVWFGGMVLVITSGRMRAMPLGISRILQGAAGVFFVGFGILLGRLRAL